MWGRGTRSIARKFFAAMAARDVDQCVRLMHPDVRYVDSGGNAAEGRDDFRELLVRLFAFTPDSRTLLSSVTLVGKVGIVRGRVISFNPRLAGEVLWKVRVERGLVREIETHRLDPVPVARMHVSEFLDRRDRGPIED